MKTHTYLEPKNPRYGDWTTIEKYLTEHEIIVTYWLYWCDQMFNHTQKDLKQLMTPDNCIDDWVTVNWATEVIRNDNTR